MASGISVLIEPEDGVGVSIYVEDCDMEDDVGKLARAGVSDSGAHEEPWVYGTVPFRQERYVPIPASMPPMPTSRPPMSMMTV